MIIAYLMLKLIFIALFLFALIDKIVTDLLVKVSFLVILQYQSYFHLFNVSAVTACLFSLQEMNIMECWLH